MMETPARDSCSFAVPARAPDGVCANEIAVELGATMVPLPSTIGAALPLPFLLRPGRSRRSRGELSPRFAWALMIPATMRRNTR